MLIVALVIFQLLFFTGLIVMLRRIMTKNVAVATQHLDELNQDYTKKEDELNKQLSEAKQQSHDLIAKAQEEAVLIQDQALKDAQGQSQRMMEEARSQSAEMIQQADKSRQALLGEMEERIAKAATHKAAELISYALPDKFRQDVHAFWVDELIAGAFHRVERLHVPDDTNEVKVTTAFPLNDAQRKALAKKMQEAFGREFVIAEVVEPQLCAGIVVTIGSLVLDGSLRNKIQEIAKSAQRQQK